jgi:hypothetical protein
LSDVLLTSYLSELSEYRTGSYCCTSCCRQSQSLEYAFSARVEDSLPTQHTQLLQVRTAHNNSGNTSTTRSINIEKAGSSFSVTAVLQYCTTVQY